LWHIAAQSIGRIADGLRRETNAANSPHEAVVLPATETSRNQPHLQVSYSQSSFQKKFCSSSALDTKIGSAEFQFSLFLAVVYFLPQGPARQVRCSPFPSSKGRNTATGVVQRDGGAPPDTLPSISDASIHLLIAGSRRPLLS
jgi:hypothetical protein